MAGLRILSRVLYLYLKNLIKTKSYERHKGSWPLISHLNTKSDAIPKNKSANLISPGNSNIYPIKLNQVDKISIKNKQDWYKASLLTLQNVTYFKWIL